MIVYKRILNNNSNKGKLVIIFHAIVKSIRFNNAAHQKDTRFYVILGDARILFIDLDN